MPEPSLYEESEEETDGCDTAADNEQGFKDVGTYKRFALNTR